MSNNCVSTLEYWRAKVLKLRVEVGRLQSELEALEANHKTNMEIQMGLQREVDSLNIHCVDLNRTIAKQMKENARLHQCLEQNRHWWESLLKHRFDISDHDLRHQIDVIDEALAPGDKEGEKDKS